MTILLGVWGICSVIDYFAKRKKAKAEQSEAIMGTLGLVVGIAPRFGNFVNYKPPFQWNTALLWLLPILLLIGAFALILFSTKKSEDEPKPLENKPYTAPKEEKNAVKFETKSAIWVFAILLVLPLSYYFSLDRFERVQQGEKEMIELANKKADTSMVHQKEDMVLKIQNKIREDVNNPELWAQLGLSLIHI